MSRIALAHPNWPEDRDSAIGTGDVVHADGHRFPCYRVIALNGNRAWVRDVQYGTDHVVPIAGFRKI
jgi:hypothetical protein